MEHDAMPLYPNNQHLYPNTQIQKMNVPNAPPQTAPVEPSVNAANMKPLLGPDNTVTVCQFCSASIRTAVKYTNTSRTHIAAALWGLVCCLCCVPYAADTAKNSDHYCPNCQRYLGTYEK